MRFVELVIQGVKCFTATQRVNLGQPRLWIAANSAGGKTTVVNLIRASLDADYGDAIQAELRPWRPSQDACRFALVCEHNGARYRITRDVGANSVVGAQMNAQTQKFDPIAPNADDVRNLLTDRLDFPAPSDWAAAFLWTEGSGGAAPAPVQADFDAAPTPTDDNAIRNRLEDLLAERQLMGGLDQVQQEIDDLHNRQFELEDEQRKLADKTAELESLRQQLEKTAILEGVDAAVLNRAKNDKVEQRREEDQRIRLEDIVEAAEKEYAISNAIPMWQRDKIFIGLCVAILLGLVVPVAMKDYNYSLLGLAGIFIGLPVMFLRYKKLGERVAAHKKQYDEAKANLDKTVAETERRRDVLSGLVKKLGTLDAKDVAQLAEERQKIRDKLDKLEATAKAEAWTDRAIAVVAELQAVQQRSTKLSDRLHEASASQRDLRTIDAEIATLKRQLERSAKGLQITAAPLAAPNAGGAPAQTPEERLRTLIASGARVARREPGDFATVIAPVVTKIVNAVFPDAFKAVNLTGDGSPQFIRAADLQALEPREVHQALLLVTAAAVQIAGAKVSAQVRAFPIVWDEPFAALDDATLSRLANVATKAAGDVQLIVLSGRKALGTAFGEPVRLGG